MPPRVAIVGAGIGGLAAAHHLSFLAAERGCAIEIVLLEASGRPGGALATELVEGALLERGPDTLVTHKPAGLALCERLGLGERIVFPPPGRIDILDRGRLLPVPAGFALLAPTRARPLLSSPLLSWRGRLRGVLEPLVPARADLGDESVASFVRRRFGAEVYERLSEPMAGGLFMADTEELSLAAGFPRFASLERERGRLLGGWRAPAVSRAHRRDPRRRPRPDRGRPGRAAAAGLPAPGPGGTRARPAAPRLRAEDGRGSRARRGSGAGRHPGARGGAALFRAGPAARRRAGPDLLRLLRDGEPRMASAGRETPAPRPRLFRSPHRGPAGGGGELRERQVPRAGAGGPDRGPGVPRAERFTRRSPAARTPSWSRPRRAPSRRSSGCGSRLPGAASGATRCRCHSGSWGIRRSWRASPRGWMHIPASNSRAARSAPTACPIRSPRARRRRSACSTGSRLAAGAQPSEIPG